MKKSKTVEKYVCDNCEKEVNIEVGDDCEESNFCDAREKYLSGWILPHGNTELCFSRMDVKEEAQRMFFEKLSEFSFCCTDCMCDFFISLFSRIKKEE